MPTGALTPSLVRKRLVLPPYFGCVPPTAGDLWSRW